MPAPIIILADIMSLGEGTRQHTDKGVRLISVAMDMVFLKQAAPATLNRWIP
ncbi:MAG: hypothetical protein KUG70_07655 [Rhodobacteraceae bacterium]|nr:hypothetical protein [Paracoccaceae bacterium]